MAVGDVHVNLNQSKAKRCAVFDGTDDYIQIPDDPSIEFGSNDFTISVWIYPLDEGRNAIWAGNSDYWMGFEHDGTAVGGQGNGTICVWVSESGLNWDKIHADAGGTGIGTAGLISAHNWYHIIFLRSGNNWKTYINGVMDLNISRSATIINKAETKSIGRWGTNSYYFNGSISGFKIWNRALTATEITNLYNEQNVTDDLIHRWKLDTNYKDSVGSMDGTNHGSRLSVVDEEVATDVKTARALGGATDNFMICDMNNKVLTAVVEET